MIHQVVNSNGNYNYNAYIYEDVIWTPHFHKNFELIYSIEGHNTVYANDIIYEINAGELILIPPGTIHSFKVNKGTRVWVGVFSSDYIAAFAKNNSNKLYSKFRCEKFIEEYLKETLFFEGTPSRYILKSALYAVCSECKNNASVLAEKSHTDTANRILEYVSENFDNSVTMKKAAEDLGYEYHYFSNVFHKCFSMNFRELVNLCRFERACEILEKTEYSLSTVALESGFLSIRNFNSVFKELSGITPTEYRKLH